MEMAYKNINGGIIGCPREQWSGIRMGFAFFPCNWIGFESSFMASPCYSLLMEMNWTSMLPAGYQSWKGEREMNFCSFSLFRNDQIDLARAALSHLNEKIIHWPREHEPCIILIWLGTKQLAGRFSHHDSVSWARNLVTQPLVVVKLVHNTNTNLWLLTTVQKKRNEMKSLVDSFVRLFSFNFCVCGVKIRVRCLIIYHTMFYVMEFIKKLNLKYSFCKLVFISFFNWVL